MTDMRRFDVAKKVPVWSVPLLFLVVPLFLNGQSNDWLIVPGVRVGPVNAKTVRADVEKLFPQATVKDDELELDEGFVLPATFVDREKRPQSLAIVWTGKTPDSHPKQVFICRGRGRGECKWHATAPGGGDIAFGTKMLDLETMNGQPFTVHGFGWGYGGNIESWDGGKLGKFDCGNSLSLGVDGQRDREGEFTTKITSEERDSFSGNRPIPTTNPALRKLNPAITELLFVFPAPGTPACGQSR
jgi:hypothetical protein